MSEPGGPPQAKDWPALTLETQAKDARAEEGGGRARQQRHQRLGRLTARERIDALCDAGTFTEFGKHVLHRHAQDSDALAANLHPGDGLVCGLAEVEGQGVVVYAHDPTVLRGALGIEGAKKLCRLLDLALERSLPVIALSDCDGVRVEEGTDAIDAYGEILRRTIKLQGKVPQLTLVCGLCVGAAAYTAALTDQVAMVQGQSYMFITGPKVTKVVTGEDVSLEDLGGAAMHAKDTGACAELCADERAGIAWLKRMLSFRRARVPSGDAATRPVPEVETIVPTAARRGYDMRKLLAAVTDAGSLLELSPKFAGNLLTALARMNGRAVAIVASNPMVIAGCLDIAASRKGAAFVTWAARNQLPILTLVDVPGYLPGSVQEKGGIIPHGATLLTAYGEADARVPLVCLVVRKSFGGASVLSFAADLRLALPTARVAPMGADATIEVVLGPENPDASEAEKAARAARKDQWLEAHDSAWAAAATGYVDRVIAPASVRAELCQALDRLCGQEER
ncbi:MAG: methylmalonyl-CoA carboxyltransferase [Deltaproteobacteria bacterium]|nr:methylmalonyl-CoA carboxyltransferase [Deltaproteobacteria bacterium]